MQCKHCGKSYKLPYALKQHEQVYCMTMIKQKVLTLTNRELYDEVLERVGSYDQMGDDGEQTYHIYMYEFESRLNDWLAEK